MNNLNPHFVVEDFLQAVLDQMYGQDRSEKTEEQAKEHIQKLVLETTAEALTAEMQKGINWVIWFQHEMLNYFASQEMQEQGDTATPEIITDLT